ncbi:MAG: glycosyltransferase family 2 protein [Eubacterium sp.]|nr:glycosyltransferase family 2 protein [Eubacterium sp.]
MFKVIIPVYNVEKYLKEAVDSVITQSLPFSDNVKIYLINDASSDGSQQICDQYKEKYPDNIFVHTSEENHGVSWSRNFGLKWAKEDPSDIVLFLDSDDKISEDTLEKAKEFFDKYPDVDMATIKIFFFGAQEGPHKANWRFEDKEVVDINVDFNYPQFYVGGLFIRGKALEKIKFDTKMHFWEDAMAVNKVLLSCEKYGLIQDPIYYYRRREDETSLVNTAWKSKDRYNKFIKQGYKRLMRYCRFKKGKIIPYIQFMVAYHLRTYLLEANQEILLETISEEEMPKFKKRLQRVLKKIDDDIILSINTRMPIIEGLLSLKYGRKITMDSEYKDGDLVFSYNGQEFDRLSEKTVRILGWQDKEGYEGMLRGRFSTPVYAMKEDDYIFAESNGQRVKSIRHGCKKRIKIFGKNVRNYKYAGFAIDIPEDWTSFRWGIHLEDGDVMLNETIKSEIEDMEE